MKNRRRSVLVAENDRAIAQTLKSRLEHAGFGVFLAYDGEQAAILAARQRFEMVYVADQLPIINGRGLLRHIRDDLNLTEVPIALCIDAETAPELESLAYTDGFTRILHKPADQGAIVEFARECTEYSVPAA